MTNAIFTALESSAYDDRIEVRYHFPSIYLRQIEATVGDWIVYYEPRATGSNSATGRQAYSRSLKSQVSRTIRSAQITTTPTCSTSWNSKVDTSPCFAGAIQSDVQR